MNFAPVTASAGPFSGNIHLGEIKHFSRLSSFGNTALLFVTLQGWFYRHVHGAADYILNNSDKTSKSAHENAVSIKNGFDREWRNKAIQFQIPIFSENAKGAWIVRFDDMIADALELGELKVYPEQLPKDISDRISDAVPEHLQEKSFLSCSLLSCAQARRQRLGGSAGRIL